MILATAIATVLAITGLTAAVATAKTRKLVLYTVETTENEQFVYRLVTPGSAFDPTLAHWSGEEGGPEPNSFYVETSSGTVTCETTEDPRSGLRGTDVTNSEPVDTVELTEAFGAISFGESKACGSTAPLGPYADVYVFPGHAIMSLNGSKGKVEIKARSASEPIEIDVFYYTGPECYYTAKSLKGTLKFATHFETWDQIVATFTKAKVKLAKPSSRACDKKATISASFGEQVQGTGPGSNLFIFGKLE
jgi:hypothetical protein